MTLAGMRDKRQIRFCRRGKVAVPRARQAPHGERFNRPGRETLYLSTALETAISEAAQGFERQARSARAGQLRSRLGRYCRSHLRGIPPSRGCVREDHGGGLEDQGSGRRACAWLGARRAPDRGRRLGHSGAELCARRVRIRSTSFRGAGVRTFPTSCGCTIPNIACRRTSRPGRDSPPLAGGSPQGAGQGRAPWLYARPSRQAVGV